jgi:hypothetical protein
MILFYSNNVFSGMVEPLKQDTNPIIDIRCKDKSCRLEDINTISDSACRYLEMFSNGRKISTYNVVSQTETELDCHNVMYVKRILLQVTIE